MKRLLVYFVLTVFLLTMVASATAAAEQTDFPKTNNGTENPEASPASGEWSTVSFAVDLTAYTASEEHVKAVGDDTFPTALSLAEEGYVEWSITVPQTGYYNITVDYLPTAGKGATASRKLLVDGELPDAACGNLLFYRSYANETASFEVNRQGDEVRPSQVEKPVWLRTALRDAGGSSQYPLRFYLTEGAHTLRFEAVKEPLTVGSIVFSDATTLPT